MARNGKTGSGRERARAFTLTELLVVVSIICLMMSLLMPALTRAQRQGEQTHCLANQRQLVLAWQQFALEHDDKLCSTHLAPTELQRYVQVPELFLCKSAAKPPGTYPTATWSCYGLAATMGGEDRDGIKGYSTLHSIGHPAERLVLTDIEPDQLMEMTFWPIMRNRGQWTWRPWSWPAHSQNMTSRHNNGCNMTFADGHGGYSRWKDARTLKLIKGIIAEPNQASVDNPDLRYMVSALAGK